MKMSENMEKPLTQSGITKIEEERMKNSLHPRFEWIDQFRGITITLLFIASFTWILSSYGSTTLPPIGPTWLNHGYKYWENSGAPLITLIDIGAQIFMFILGISVPISFRSKWEKKGLKYAWCKTGTRVLAFFWINSIVEWLGEWGDNEYFYIGLGLFALAIVIGIIGLTKFKNTDTKAYIGLVFVGIAFLGLLLMNYGVGHKIWDLFFNAPLCHLAWGTLAATIAVYTIHSPDRRIVVMIFMMIVHTFFWQTIYKVSINEPGSIIDGMSIPYDVLGHMLIAISATCVWDWMNLDPKEPNVGIKQRVLKFASLMFIVAFLYDFIEPANHHGTNLVLCCLAIGTGTFMCIILYTFERYFTFKVPVISELGRNAILLYLLQSAFTLPYDEIFPDNAVSFWGMFPLPWGRIVGLLLAVLPIAGLMAFAVLLDRKNIHFKF
jgi:hypothetical protein